MSAPAPLAGAGRVAGAAALIAVLTVAARLAGFARTAVFTWVVEKSDLGGMYVIANTVPNIVFEIVAGGALASLVVPLLAGAVAAGDRTAVAATTGALLTWTVTLLVPLAALVALLADPIIAAISTARSPDELAAGARMLRVFAPQLPLYGVGIVLTGVLQAHRRFAWPVLAPLLSSLTVIVVYLAFACAEGRGATVVGVSRGGELILSAGTTLGVLVLSLSLLVPLRRLGLRPRLGYAFTADVRARVGGLAVAGAVTVTAQQVALLVILNRVSGGPTGSPQVFNLAQTMYLLPWAVLAVPLAVAAYPTLAAASAAGDEDGYRRTLAPTVRGVLLFSCLGAAALVGTAAPVAAFFYPTDPDGTAAAIAGFAPGLLGYGLFAALSRALYARGDTRPATVAITLGWLAVPMVALPLAAVLPVGDRVLAVALANSAGMLLLGVLLLVAVRRAAGPAALAGSLRAGIAGVLAATAAALAGAQVAGALAGTGAGTPTTSGAVLEGMLSGAVVGVVFLAVAYPADRRDVGPLLAGVVRRLPVAGRVRRRRAEPEDGRVDR
ncbi:murein biosynthesis integral membrane protein MurJ [Micromonospora sagamiensis]|uniref:Putative peptidoglycan lipid II flippase n=1 Tax=Micromonospora sagamiensis TaxID=47875 RepID=A0A562WIF2_9ACTN|nr:lipid II flippase MurJ [Micromonospora sagamiensis]TWJ29952.1 putative peptidoglycan lipid II flippase [Micromonospora sagamiensis]BCL17020.1 membrane protein [Micromonospora sagamiensis]